MKKIISFNLKLLYKILRITPKHVICDNIFAKKHLVFPGEIFVMPELKDVFGDKHQPYFNGYETQVPDFYAIELPNAYTFTNREEVWTENHEIILDHTTQKQNLMKNQFINFKKAQRIEGRVVQLSLTGLENNYYHWLTECLGRLYILKNAGITPDYYIVKNELSFQKQWLELLGIGKERIISSSKNCLIRADCLVITTFINNWKPIQYVPGVDFYQKIWLPSWIGNQYKEIAGDISLYPANNIYITRKNAKYRKMVNEDELIPILYEYDFKIIDLDALSVIEQIKTFRSAKQIIGIHGAGLVNMFFCRQDARILEIYPSNCFDPSFRLQAVNLKLDYAYIIGTEVVRNRNINPQRADIYVNKAIFKNAINTFFKFN